MEAKTFFSDFMWSICLSLITADFLRHFKAKGSDDSGSSRCLTKRTRPNVPVPRVCKILKSFR